MKNKFFVIAFAIVLISCSDESDRLACEKATQELEDIQDGIRLLQMHAPPNICNPCTAQQVYQIELSKLRQKEAEYKSKKNRACNY